MTNSPAAIQPTFHQALESFSHVLQNTTISDLSRKNLLLDEGMQAMIALLRQAKTQEATVYLVGNGGSAAICSHAVIDFLNMVKMRAMAFLDPAVTTCLSNDYGYETVYERQLLQFARPGDVLIAISSSGNSKNILKAVEAAKSHKLSVITLSGFSENNLLRQSGELNLWLNSTDYGQVEIGHALILHYLTDRLKEC